MACFNMIVLHHMPQLAEAVHQDDDWTGVTDAGVRRRRQNRLNSRAFRRRRKVLEEAAAAESQPSQTLGLSQSQFHTGHPPGQRANSPLREKDDDEAQGGQTEGEGDILVPCWIEARQCVTSLRMSMLANNRPQGCRRALLPYDASSPARLDQVIFPLSADHLLTLIQYNILRGCLENRRLLREAFRRRCKSGNKTVWPNDDCPVVGYQGDDDDDGREWSATALTVFPTLTLDGDGDDDDDVIAPLSRILPRSLHPTSLQNTVPHAAWIDILPHPVLRDNLIRATTSLSVSESSAADGTTNSASNLFGVFDPDDLWTDSVGGLFFETGPSPGPVEEGKEEEEEVAGAVFVGGIVWSPPWDISGWELSEGFWRKWGWMMKGCAGEVLEATNRWRRQRGEEELQLGWTSVG
ncbi:hypothetical protein AYL99_09905 [Fonsecaea erecta]|uniref:BZIP domain-containing protein n=1 Tax=Fonsecaea erecta TaxID=1367422 RepID=A0A178Z988_9EURO|nr:hypothetical protein AYL99_09905 [Fonsecaea erecta]OAP55753.1 hypothetical protein AYL99_09905 [Fonsecaea erecta]